MTVDRAFWGSLTRIADLGEWPLPVEPQDRSAWDNGDYAVVEVGLR